MGWSGILQNLISAVIGGIITALVAKAQWRRELTERVKPVLVFQSMSRPVGQHISRENALTSALFEFEVSNEGSGVAVLGDNPFREIGALQVISNEFSGKPQPDQLIGVPEGQHVPNILRSKESVRLQVALGHFGDRPMDDPFTFFAYYSDTMGNAHRTEVKIHPRTGDVESSRVFVMKAR